jgi:urea carboxylase-associated protein 1
MPESVDVVVAAGAPWGGTIGAGRLLEITDLEGEQGVDFLAWSAAEPLERYNAPNTIKKAASLYLTTGHRLLSDVARPLLTIVEDSWGLHDTIGGCCSEPSNEALYGVPGRPGCRENLLAAMAPLGLGRRDLVPNVNFFCQVPVQAENTLLERTFAPATSKPGDRVVLRAEMDVLVAISNCPQTLNPATGGKPTPIRIRVSDP